MNTQSKSGGEKPVEGINSIPVMLARIVLTLLGPAVMGLVALVIVNRGNGWLTPLDGFYGIAVALMIGARWVEQRSGTATTVTGEPSTPMNFRRYVILLLFVAAVVWVGANVIGNHVLR